MPKLKQIIVKYGQPCPECGLSWAHGSVPCNYPYPSEPIKQTENLREQFNKLVEKETTLCGDEVEVVWSFIQKALTLEHDRAIEKINKQLQTINQNTVAYEQGRKEERERWLNQKANDHDNKIRADERERIKKSIKKLSSDNYKYSGTDNLGIKIYTTFKSSDYMEAVESILDLLTRSKKK